MLEVQTSMYAPRFGGVSLLPERCDDCLPGSRVKCEDTWFVDGNGYSTRAEDPDVRVKWPACPWTWGVFWQQGQDYLPPDHVVAYAAERGVHRGRSGDRLSAGGHRLIRRWLREHEWPSLLAERRHFKDEERKRSLQQHGATVTRGRR